MPNEKDLNRRDFLITGAPGLTALGSVAFPRSRLSATKKRRGCCATAIEATERLSWCRKKSEACWTTASRRDNAERNAGSSPAGVVEIFPFSYARPAGAVSGLQVQGRVGVVAMVMPGAMIQAALAPGISHPLLQKSTDGSHAPDGSL
jgi:hypothetical protein